MASAGNGPVCPVGGDAHGRTYDYRQKALREGHDWWCGHSAHGGNGRFFTDEEVRGGYELQEGDVALIYETTARDVIAGKLTLDKAVQDVARTTKRSTSQVREAVTIMIDSIKEKDQTMADKKAAAKKKTAKQPGERRRLEHVDGAGFQKVIDDLGMTAAQTKEATGEAGMGASSTYVYILLHEGASVNLFSKFETACKTWAKSHRAELKGKAKPKAAAEPEAEAVAVEA